MPPTCSLDVAALGPVFILKTSLNDETCKIEQPVHTNIEITDEILRTMEMSTYDLEEPPVVRRGDESGVFIFGFDPDTVEDTIPALLQLVFDEYAVRMNRHRQFMETGPLVAVYSELKTHG